MSKNAFPGFTRAIFDTCETGTDSINIARAQLDLLRQDITKQVRDSLKFDRRLNGKVSETKDRGTHSYNEWAWLMFTTAPLGTYGRWKDTPVGASKLTQLTININRKNLYVGLCVKTRVDSTRLQTSLYSDKNAPLFDSIVESMGSTRWVITTRDFNDRDVSRYYDESELRVALLDPKIMWINARIDRKSVISKGTTISKEIVKIFNVLYNIYALSVGLGDIPQPKSKVKPWKTETVNDQETTPTEDDDELLNAASNLLSELGGGTPPPGAKIGGREDTYRVKRKVLPFNPKLRNLDVHGQIRTYYIDSGYSEKELKTRLPIFDEFRIKLDRIASRLNVDTSFFEIVITKPVTDARYLYTGRNKKTARVLVNLLRYEKIRSEYFWLVTVSREIAYIFAKRLNYNHQNIMRRILVSALTDRQTAANNSPTSPHA